MTRIAIYKTEGSLSRFTTSVGEREKHRFGLQCSKVSFDLQGDLCEI